MTVFVLPDLGEGLDDAEIVAWHVAAGDHVVADQPLVAVETAKAVVEVPAPHSGHIARLCAKVGERVKVGAPLVEYEEGPHRDVGAVVGEIAPPEAKPAPPQGRPAALSGARRAAAPAIRALARERGVDLSAIAGTGPQGSVTRADVEAAAASEPATIAEPVASVRRAMALAMARSGAEIVPATVTDDADVDDWPVDADVTQRLADAIVAGCRAAPALNAWFDPVAMTRRLHTQVDLGIAIDTSDGLFVPVLRDVAARSAAELRAAIETIKRDVAARRIALADLRGQTITLSNFGTLGGRYAALAIVPPQVAILGAGRARPTAAVRDGAVAVRRILPLSLTFDHRVVTGGEAARFLAAVIAALEAAS